MKITAKTKMCVIIGNPVEHSLSPAMHNAAYEALGIDNQFVFAAAKVKVEDVKKVVEAVRVMGIRGLTCTIPHKLEVMKYLDEIDLIAQKIGAVNTVVNDDGVLRGYNTDWLGVVTPLKKVVKLKGKKVAILGAGGAARAMSYGAMAEGAKLKIFNRDFEQAKSLAQEFEGEAGDFSEIRELIDFDIIMNATPVGMTPRENQTLVPEELFNANQVVFDAVYTPRETRLLREAKLRGAKIITGLEMLLYQGTAQFELYTKRKAPVEVMRRVLLSTK